MTGGIGVIARKGESIDKLLQRLKKSLKDENVVMDMRKHDFFVKPSEKRRLKKRRKKLTNGTQIENNK